MTLSELISQLDQLAHDEKIQVLDHLIEGLEHETSTDITVGESAAEDQDDAHWDASLAKSQDMLAQIAAQIRQHRDQGLNQELDPDNL